MRSPIGPVLILLGLATTVVLVLLLFQTIALRNDLDSAREQVATLQTRVEAQEAGVTPVELRRELDELRSWTRDWLIATDSGGGSPGGSVGTPAGGNAAFGDVVQRLDEVLERIEELNDRVDQICEGVPVC